MVPIFTVPLNLDYSMTGGYPIAVSSGNLDDTDGEQ